MIHPNTELRFINKKKGRGVFAIRFIPKGTITYVKDDLEIEITPDDPRLADPAYKDIVETYSYTDGDGIKIISWDHAKYVNHCCQCNTMSTGYGFEIAIRDIIENEEITDEYGMFNFRESMKLNCEKSPCRKTVSGFDLSRYYKEWDEVVKDALKKFSSVEQPLADFLTEQTKSEIDIYLNTGNEYRSVQQLYCLEE